MTPQAHTPKKALQWLLLGIAILAISLSPIITRAAEAPALIIATYRMLWATALTLIFYRGSVPELSRATPKQWLLMLLSGIALALHFWTWIASLDYTTVALSTLLVSVHPLVVIPLGYYFFGESLSPSRRLGMVLVLAGTLGLYVFGQTPQPGLEVQRFMLGNLLALIGAATVALYLLLGKGLRQHLSTGAYTLGVYGVAAFCLLLLAAFSKGSDLMPAAITWQDHLLFIAMAVIPTLLGHTLLNYLLQWQSAGTISLATLGEPVIASLLAWVLFGEALTTAVVLFGAVILAGIAATEMDSR